MIDHYTEGLKLFLEEPGRSFILTNTLFEKNTYQSRLADVHHDNVLSLIEDSQEVSKFASSKRSPKRRFVVHDPDNCLSRDFLTLLGFYHEVAIV